MRRLFPPKPEQGWTGEVIRTNPAEYQKPPEIEIVRCRQRWCGHWTPVRLVYCQICHQPRDGSVLTENKSQVVTSRNNLTGEPPQDEDHSVMLSLSCMSATTFIG